MLNVALIGTSWWAEAMYLPALADHPDGRITLLCGRNAVTAASVAERWAVPEWTTDWRDAIDRTDAVIVAATNETHAEMARYAVERGKAVLCEKPVALSAAEAEALADAAQAADITSLVPFTYRWMPAFAWAKQLIDEGYVGRVHSLNLRYHTGYALGGEYAWRFDKEIAGSGVIGDLGSHWLHYARWWCGEVTHVGAVSETCVQRALRPDGSDYVRNEDSAVITVRFEGGGLGILQVSAAAYEGDGFGQTHNAEIHGSEGTLHIRCDWRDVQEVRGLRRGEPGPPAVLAMPVDLVADVRRDTVHNTYRDVFRHGDASARLWLSAAARGERCSPDLREGARVQRLTDAALESAAADGVLLAV